jgi:hypothetical protein
MDIKKKTHGLINPPRIGQQENSRCSVCEQFFSELVKWAQPGIRHSVTQRA